MQPAAGGNGTAVCACERGGDVALGLRWEQVWLPESALAGAAGLDELLSHTDEAGLDSLVLAAAVLLLVGLAVLPGASGES